MCTAKTRLYDNLDSCTMIWVLAWFQAFLALYTCTIVSSRFFILPEKDALHDFLFQFEFKVKNNEPLSEKNWFYLETRFLFSQNSKPSRHAKIRYRFPHSWVQNFADGPGKFWASLVLCSSLLIFFPDSQSKVYQRNCKYYRQVTLYPNTVNSKLRSIQFFQSQISPVFSACLNRNLSESNFCAWCCLFGLSVAHVNPHNFMREILQEKL